VPAAIQSGIDVFLKQKEKYKTKTLALVTNDAARTATGEYSRAALLKQNLQLIKLFSPEHGIAVKGKDGAAQQNNTDALTALPVISLYSSKLAPSAEDLKDADLVLFDIPDVGCRFYTYLWTMTHVMEACAANNKPLLILDRPNPIGAMVEKAEGPMLDETNCSSFIGRWNIPLKHGCTPGELALYFAATKLPELTMDVIKVENYHRRQNALHDFLFIPTSPAIQTIETALLYPGTGLFEGVNVNEARGTDEPFRQFGAPWINENELTDALQQKQLMGIAVKPASFKAVTCPYAGETCCGVELIITDPLQLMAVQNGVTILQTIAGLYPSHFNDRLYPTAANPTGEKHLDKLLGVQNAFQKLISNHEFALPVSHKWKQLMEQYLLYS
jgi:uncharacterized protein YbbC (DUF1343 family)